MTHGIIYTKSKYSSGGDSLRDFSDYVMMYYMRGLQLKEWYINPYILSPQQWEVLARHTRWSQEHVQTLANSVFVGGDPSQGKVYGYMCWNGDHGIFSVRNPSPGEAEIDVPFDQSTWYRGASGKEFRPKVVYPYQGELAATLRSGEPIKLRVPGYTLRVLQLEPGRGASEIAEPTMPSVRIDSPSASVVKIPDEAMQRCDLMMISHTPAVAGKTAALPDLKVNGDSVPPSRKAAGPGWGMISVDLQSSRGKELRLEASRLASEFPDVEGWLIMDRPIHSSPADVDPRLPMPVSQGFVRQTVRVFGTQQH
jgi:hypothetical protein